LIPFIQRHLSPIRQPLQGVHAITQPLIMHRAAHRRALMVTM
jgi:hypothetical protein